MFPGMGIRTSLPIHRNTYNNRPPPGPQQSAFHMPSAQTLTPHRRGHIPGQENPPRTLLAELGLDLTTNSCCVDLWMQHDCIRVARWTAAPGRNVTVPDLRQAQHIRGPIQKHDTLMRHQ